MTDWWCGVQRWWAKPIVVVWRTRGAAVAAELMVVVASERERETPYNTNPPRGKSEALDGCLSGSGCGGAAVVGELVN